MTEHLDVAIIGAGLSGIGAAWRLQHRLPHKSFAILEAREAIGGTWDLFRYPGVRSDSDMYTLGYAFRPWREPKAIADGPSILAYIRETAREAGLASKIRFSHRVVRADWSSADARWRLTIARSGPAGNDELSLTCSFLFVCSGYYRYDAGYAPAFKGASTFAGRIVHPQAWPNDLAYDDQRVVVIGSGATAVTLVPEMAKRARHVTMLQRSPTYIVARPARDEMALWLQRRLPAKLAYALTRWRNVALGMYVFRQVRAHPAKAKQILIEEARKQLGPDVDVGKHFTPRYAPWDQRLCLAPDGDFFQAVRSGAASVVTDVVDAIDEGGIKLASGARLEADLIVTATGLDLQFLGGIALSIDGRRPDPKSMLTYKGMMYADVPNLATAFGYTNASWTLKCDLTCEYVCRLLDFMDRSGHRICTAHNDDPALKAAPWLDFSSGYVQRALDRFPRQGARKPWRLHQNYALDLLDLRLSPIKDPALRFA